MLQVSEDLDRYYVDVYSIYMATIYGLDPAHVRNELIEYAHSPPLPIGTDATKFKISV